MNVSPGPASFPKDAKAGRASPLIPDHARLESAYRQASPLYQYALLVIEQRLRETLERGAIRPSIKGRIKDFDSLYAKRIRISKDARLAGMEPVPVTDVIAVRVICPFLGDLQEAEYLIRASFTVVEIERKGSERSFREFGYESIHMLAELPPDLADAGTGLDKGVFEIQLRTILQEAWAEVEHELVYKAEFTPFDEPLKRKLAALNATLSLSDIIFQEILDYQRRLNMELERRRDSFYGKIEESMDKPFSLSSKEPEETASEGGLQEEVPPVRAPVVGDGGAAGLAILAPFMSSFTAAEAGGSRPKAASVAAGLVAGDGADPWSGAGEGLTARAGLMAEPGSWGGSGPRSGDDAKSESYAGDREAASLPSFPLLAEGERFRTLDELLLSALEAHNRGDFAIAVECYSSILARTPVKEIASVVYKHRGMAYFSQSRYDLALEDFGRSLAMDPVCYKSAYYRGVVRSVLQDFSRAIADFNLALDIHPFHFWSRYRRAMAFFQIGDYPQSLADCEAALKLQPSSRLASGLRDLARSKIQF